MRKCPQQLRAKRDARNKAVSLILEYIILAGILSVFVVILSLQLNDVLESAQVDRVIQNQFSDVAAQVSTLYTDYILIRPSRGEISTTLSLLPEVGDYSYMVNFRSDGNSVYLTVKTPDEKYVANSSLGFRFFLYEDGVQSINASGESLSLEAHSEVEEKPEIKYEKKNETCDYIPKPRLVVSPTSIDLQPTETKYVNVELFFTNADEIGNVGWNLTYWGGSITNTSRNWDNLLPINWTTILSSSNCNVSYPKATCYLNVVAWQSGKVECNSSFSMPVFISADVENSPPQLHIGKWIEPSVVGVNEPFEIHIRLEGRGFSKSGGNLTTVHVVDVSGSMIETTQYEDFKGEGGNENVVTPKVVTVHVNLSEAGTLKVYAYTNDTLPQWYSDSLCKACSGYESNCPWYGKGYADEFVKLQVDSISAFSSVSGSGFGKEYSANVSAGWHTIKVVARAPDAIDLKIDIVAEKNISDCVLQPGFKNTTVVGTNSCSITIQDYMNYKDLELNLPALTGYLYMRIDDVSDIPEWEDAECPSSSTKLTDGYCSYSYYPARFIRHWERVCGSDGFYDGNLHVWVIDPSSQKDMLYKVFDRLRCRNIYDDGEWWNIRFNDVWHVAWDNYYEYGYGGEKYYSDYFVDYPTPGTYKIRISPLTFTNANFTGKAYIERLDAAKVAVKTFNNMLGNRDFVGLVKFSTSASRISVNTSPLEYLTTDKTRVNNEIENYGPSCATDPAEGLYNALKVFPIWNEANNNCTECINNTRPVVILLTDGRPTTCNDNYPDVDCPCNGDPKQQAVCMANVLKSTQVNGYNITLCTIGFGPDIDENAQDFLREIASPRPDNESEKCYFFARTGDDLAAAFREIYNIFRIAAKNVTVHDTVNTTFETSLEIIDIRAYKYYTNFTRDYSTCGSNPPCWDITSKVSVGSSPNGTVVGLELDNIKFDEVVEIIITARQQETGVFQVNHPDSWVEYTSVDIMGEDVGVVRKPLNSDVYVVVTERKGAEVTLD